MSRRLALIVLLFGSPVSAQVLREPARAGSDFLRHLVVQMKFTLATDFAEVNAEPARSIIISLGDPDWLNRHDLSAFVGNGGGLLVATDQSFEWSTRTETFAIQNTPVVCRDDEYTYDNKPELMALFPPDDAIPPIPLGGRVVVSLPSRMSGPRRFARTGLWPIAILPPGCEFQQGGRAALTEGQRLFAVAGTFDTGKVALIADGHLFMNDLLARSDLQNYEFAGDVVGFLRLGTPERTRCLFVENGRVLSTAPEKLDALFETPWEMLRRQMAMLEARLGAAEERGEIHQALWSFLRDRNISSARVAAYVAGILTLLGAIYLFYRVIQSRVATEANLPRLATSVSRQVPSVRLHPGRVEEQLERGQLYEPARHLVRRMLLLAGCQPALRPPRVHITGGWWRRWRVGARFHRLWKLAFGKRPVPIRARDWAALLVEIESVRNALLKGEIQLESVQPA